MAATNSNRTMTRWLIQAGLFCAVLALGAVLCSPQALAAGANKSSKAVQDKLQAGTEDTLALIVTYNSPPGEQQRNRIGALGGSVKSQFRSIDGMAVDLPASAVEALAQDPDVAWVTEDAVVRAAMDVALPTASLPPAGSPDELYTGAGVTVAVLDSGIDHHDDTDSRVLYRVATASMRMPTEDLWGHGTHVAGIIAGNGTESGGLYRGVAPGAAMVAIRMLDDTGEGYTSAVIGGLDVVLDMKDVYGIRVVNISLGKAIQEEAAKDPLVQAVEKVWDAGIVVVCSAGNFGREGYFTITSPGNSRKAITVGALTDWNTADTADDSVASYSSRGPTLLDHFAKPDLLAPGNRLVSQRAYSSTLDDLYPDWRVGSYYLELSGTSMAAGVVSGAAALMLEKDPTLNPDSVKARLMRSARTLPGADPMMQGAGLIDIAAALQESGRTDTAWSPIVYREEAEGVVSTEDTALLWGSEQWSLAVLWSDAVLWTDAVLWGDAVLWTDAVLWGDAVLWADAVMWSDVVLWTDSVLWSDVVLWSDSVMWADSVPISD
jgi:serine protease AprX